MKKKVVLITGGSRGLGRAMVQLLRKEYIVLAPTRQELDLLKDDSISRYLERVHKKKIQILINNAGINVPQWIEDMTDENIRDTVQINLIAPIKLIRGVAGGMKKRKWGRIVNISSAFGIVGRGKQTLYVATKHGINGITKALALELAPYNILVNSICPGFAETDLVLKRNTPEKIKHLESDIPLGRLVTPKEIAETVKFLISEKNTYMTGESLIVDGGFTIK